MLLEEAYPEGTVCFDRRNGGSSNSGGLLLYSGKLESDSVYTVCKRRRVDVQALNGTS